MLTDEVRDKLVRQILVALDECYREEIERWRGIAEKLRTVIEVHQQSSFDLIKDNPAVRMSEADYELWEVLQD